MSEKKIYESTLIYSILRVYTNFTFRRWFSSIEINGSHLIPEGAPVIFAPNHQNALMDAMALLQAAPRPVVFLARADLFKRKFVAKLLNMIRIMPAYRKRDGMHNLKKNEETFNTSVETLLHNSLLCLMPEGGQEEKRSLRPLVKGIFRIAFSAQEKLPDGKFIRIVPVGIDYGNYDHTGRHLIINFGSPISLKNYVDLYAESPALAMNKIKMELSKRISPLMLDIRSEKHYEMAYVSSYLYNSEALDIQDLEDNETNRLAARQYVADRLAQAEQNDNPTIERLNNLCMQWSQKHGEEVPFVAKVADLGNSFDGGLLLHILYLVAASLPALYGLIVNLIPYASIKHLTKPSHGTGFEASFVYGSAGLLFPPYYLIMMIISFFFSPTMLFWFAFILSMPLSFFFLLRYRWRAKFVKQRLKNIFYKDEVSAEIKEILGEIIRKG